MPYPPNVDPGIGILYFNVHDEGAVGDGFTDDAAAIQRTIDASVEGSVIFFPSVHAVGTTIEFLGNRTYMGTNGSTIKMLDGANLVAVVASKAWLTDEATSGNPITITNLTIDGNYLGNLSGHGIVLMNFNSVIRECTVKNCYDNGIMLSSIGRSGSSISNTCVENRIESCKVSNCLGYGIYGHDTDGKLIDGYIDSCIVSEATNVAIRLERGTGWFVSHNYCYDNLSSGISVDNCYSTFIIDNKIDGYGQSNVDSGFISGIGVTVIGPHPTIVSRNNIATTEPNASYHYRHLNITFGGLTETRCFVHGNVIRGGFDANPNSPSGTSFSQAIAYQVNGTQTGGGQPAYLIASHNHYRNSGNAVFLDSYITPTAAEHVGDVQLDRHLVVSNSLTGVPALAALTNNGTSPPTPTFSSVGGTDIRGRVRFGSGGSPSSGDQASVTFAKAYVSPPIVSIFPQNTATAALGLYVSSISTTGFNIAVQNAPADSQGGTTYSAAFIVMG